MDAPQSLPRTWMSRLVDVLQPLSVRADRLAATRLFTGLDRAELELAGALLNETLIQRGTRLTIQGTPCSRMWIILEGQALASADARPIRVVGVGDVIGLASILLAVPAPETTIALSPIRAFEIDPGGFAELLNVPPIRTRLSATAGLSAMKRSTRRRS